METVELEAHPLNGAACPLACVPTRAPCPGAPDRMAGARTGAPRPLSCRETGEPGPPAPGGRDAAATASAVGAAGVPDRGAAPLDAAPRARRRGGRRGAAGASCGRSRASDRGGGTAARIIACARRAGRSTASGCSGCGARRGCGCRRKRRKRHRLGESTVPGDAAAGRAAQSRVGARLPVR